MKVKWLGWAGVEVEADGATVVIDPLAHPGATFAPLGEEARRGKLPLVVSAQAGKAVAGLVTHLHRDHADGTALAAALADDASVHEPAWPGGEDVENLALAQADAELDRAGLRRAPVEPWQRVEAGPFTLTALPAVDGLGDPQVSWVVEADGRRALHLGDTVFHGYWWRMERRHGPFDVVLAPINGAVVDFPHLQPPSPLAAAMEPEQAALAGELLDARTMVPIHFDGFEIEPWYRPVRRRGPLHRRGRGASLRGARARAGGGLRRGRGCATDGAELGRGRRRHGPRGPPQPVDDRPAREAHGADGGGRRQQRSGGRRCRNPVGAEDEHGRCDPEAGADREQSDHGQRDQERGGVEDRGVDPGPVEQQPVAHDLEHHGDAHQGDDAAPSPQPPQHRKSAPESLAAGTRDALQPGDRRGHRAEADERDPPWKAEGPR